MITQVPWSKTGIAFANFSFIWAFAIWRELNEIKSYFLAFLIKTLPREKNSKEINFIKTLVDLRHSIFFYNAVYLAICFQVVLYQCNFCYILKLYFLRFYVFPKRYGWMLFGNLLPCSCNLCKFCCKFPMYLQCRIYWKWNFLRR